MPKPSTLRPAHCNTGTTRLCANKGARPLWFSACFLLALFTSAAWSQHGHVLDLPREGSATLHLDPTAGYAYIVDGGRRGSGITSVQLDEEPVLDALRSRGIRDLVLICSHPHADHLGGLLEMVEQDAFAGFRKLWFVDSGYSERVQDKRSLAQVYEQRRAREPQLPDGEKIDVAERRGNVLVAGGDVTVETFQEAPRLGGGSEHDRAIITTIRYRGHGGLENRVVDADDASDGLVRRWTEWALEDPEARRPDTLVVPHHGARTTDIRPLLQVELLPTSVVIPVNRANRYDHPNLLTLIRLTEALGGLDNVHITAVDGTVELGAQGVTSAQNRARRTAYFAALAERQRLKLVSRMIEREERLLTAEGETRRALARAQARDGETLRAFEELAGEFSVPPLPSNTGEVTKMLREARAKVTSANPGRSFPWDSEGRLATPGRRPPTPLGGGGRRALFAVSKTGFPTFGGVIMGAGATLSNRQRPVSAEIVVVQGRAEIRITLRGTESRVIFAGATETELAVALDFVSGRHEGTHPDDVGLVGLVGRKEGNEEHWQFALHPAVANTVVGGNLMRIDMLPDMLPSEVYEAAGAADEFEPYWSYQWHDREAVLDIVDGRLQVSAQNESPERLLALRFVPENPGLAAKLSNFLRARSWTFRHIERFAEAVLVLHWLADHGVQPTGADRLTVIRWPVEPELHRSDLGEEIAHLAASKEVN